MNAAFAKGEAAQIDAELMQMLKTAQDLSRASDRLFNPAIGKLITLWGFHRDNYEAALPDPAVPTAAPAAPVPARGFLRRHATAVGLLAVLLTAGGYWLAEEIETSRFQATQLAAYARSRNATKLLCGVRPQSGRRWRWQRALPKRTLSRSSRCSPERIAW